MFAYTYKAVDIVDSSVIDSKEDAVLREPIPALIRAFLRQEYASIDKSLPHYLKVLSDVGASETAHKLSSFKEHMFQIFKIMKIWGQRDEICRCALFHGAYTNKIVSLAIFPNVDSRLIANLVGEETEKLIYRFSAIPRGQLLKTVVHNRTDEELAGYIGELEFPDINTGQPIKIDRTFLAELLVLILADFIDQSFSWQDELFGNSDGKMLMTGNDPQVLWPGVCKPGLWHSAMSRIAHALKGVVEGAEIGEGYNYLRHAVPLPLIFDHCSVILPESNMVRARDLYWEVVYNKGRMEHQTEALALLQEVVALNPYIAEPHLLMAQIYLHRHCWSTAEQHARCCIQLFCEWGTQWDKRMSWDVWLAYARVALIAAVKQEWPDTAFGMVNIGTVATTSADVEAWKLQNNTGAEKEAA